MTKATNSLPKQMKRAHRDQQIRYALELTAWVGVMTAGVVLAYVWGEGAGLSVCLEARP